MGVTRTSARYALRVLLVGLAAGLGLVLLPPPAQASSASDFVSRINAERSARGLPTLVVRGDLAGAAQAQAQRMADASEMFHNPNLGGSVAHWSMLAENVGYGPDVARIHAALMASAPHRGNVLNKRYTEVGVGVVVRDHVMWVAEVFRLPSGSKAGSSGGHQSSSKPPAKKAAASAPSARSAGAATARSTPGQTKAAAARPAHRAHAVLAAEPPMRALRLARAADASTLATAPAPPAAVAAAPPAPAGRDDTAPTAVFMGLGVLALALVAAATRVRLG